MVELLSVILGLATAILATALAVFAMISARRFEERRFWLIGGAFLTLAFMGAAAFVSEAFELQDEQFAVGPAPLVLVVIALTLLYLALLQGRRRPETHENG